MKEHNWRLPDGVEELLPPAPRARELLRRQILDLFDAWGYDYVVPPMIEYLDALLVGSGSDLELQTFRMVDQLSGRMLGIRADMTSRPRESMPTACEPMPRNVSVTPGRWFTPTPRVSSNRAYR